MIRIRYFFTVFIISGMISCRGNISAKHIQPESTVSPVEVESTAAYRPIAPITDTPKSTTPVSTATQPNETPLPSVVTSTAYVVELNPVPELSGRLFVGNYNGSYYIELDLEKNLVTTLELPTECHLLANGQKAVCVDNSFTDKAVTYVYDVFSKQKDFQFDEKGGVGRLTSGERHLEYIRELDNVTSIYAYDLENNKSFHIGEFDNKGALAIPQLSNSGDMLIGIDYQIKQVENDDRWYFMRVKSLIAEPILTPENIVATESFTWAPDDTSVALIGYFREEGSRAHEGETACGRVALVYDPLSQSTILSVRMPDQRCVTDFHMMSFYSDKYFWSPDSSKLALILDQQGICIIDVLNKANECSLIADFFGTDIYLWGLAWSPDSKYLAYTWKDELRVLSLEDGNVYNLANIAVYSPPHIGDKLAWGR